MDLNIANLFTSVNTSVLKKSIDTNEQLAAKLIEGMQENTQNQQTTSSNGLLDIYA
ncbi:YjfB family protein [Campylobacter sp. MIT 21-1685]|uniref:YjfB family protein n=1 Tax=unclassified Campylobacter TaxID=2593542 RepID=UPI00224A513A|nr:MULTISPECIES: YjfB family protein [unclassified Campylobacter]MCX2682695.1 YjfB family protein [Campylobacter sp. MIT 21-1684]MCX2750975.1 YjfB family protein [Campylobacter sp. MIT 21-1682]MCX2807092.1 YjfB family protein [Campylobacter sp. MIT 21-1685]